MLQQPKYVQFSQKSLSFRLPGAINEGWLIDFGTVAGSDRDCLGRHQADFWQTAENLYD